MFTKLEGYAGKRARYSYPADEIDPKFKENKEYFLSFCNAMIADHASNAFQVPFDFGMNRTFEEIRRYMQGKQHTTKYKDILIGPNRKDADGKHITTMNISWDIYDVISEKRDKMRGKMQKLDFDIDARCIDPDSLQAKENDKAAMKFFLNPSTKAFQKATGLKATMNPESLGIENEEDVDLYHDTGAYTTQREIACIAACNKSKMVSGYKDIQDKCMDDLTDIGIAGWKTYIDKATKEVKFRYVDPQNAIIPYSQYNDFRNINKGGEIREITIAEVRKENPELTADDLLYIAKCYSYMNPEYGQMLNSTAYQSTNTSDYSTSYVDPINRCRIKVLDAQWLSVDIEKTVKNIWPNGRVFRKDVPFDYQLDDKAKKSGDKIIQKKVIKKYYATWIIGTDYLLSKGICEDVVYYGPDGNKTPRPDYFFVKTGGKSIGERVISIADDIQMAKLRLRNALACMPPPPGIIIQEHLLENVFLGNELKQSPEDLLHTLMEKGILVVNSLDDSGKPVFQNQKPIEYIPQGIIEQLTIFRNEIQAGIQELDIVMGISGAPEASVQNPYAGLGSREMAKDSADNGFYPTFNAYKKLFLDSMEDVVKKWQIIARDTDIKVNYSPLGTRNMKVLALGKEFTNSDYNISLELSAGEQQRRDLIGYIISLRDQGVQTQNQQGLTSAEFLYVYERIMGGNIKEAMFVLAQIERKKQIQNDKNKIASEERTFKGQQESSIVANEEARKTAVLEESEKRKTAIVTEAMKRKTAVTTQYLKSQEGGEGVVPMDEAVYFKIIADINDEIAAIIADDARKMNPQPQQQEQEQMAA